MLGISLVKLDILSDQTIGFLRDHSDLIFGEILLTESGNLSKVRQVSFDTCLRVIGFLFDFGKGESFEIKVDDDCFVRETWSHVLFCPSCHDEHAQFSQGIDISFDRGGTGG